MVAVANQLDHGKVANFKCLSDWCLLEPVRETVTKGGIELPDGVSAAGDLGRLRVVKVGPGALLNDGVSRDEMPVKPGDYIWRVGQVRPMEIRLDGKTYVLLQAREFIAIDTRGDDVD